MSYTLYSKLTLSCAIYMTLISQISALSSPIVISKAFDDIINGLNSSQVRGQVTVLPSGLVDKTFTDTGNGFAIQDETGGIWVYIENESFYATDTSKKDKLTYGRWVTVTGRINTATGVNEKSVGGLVRITPNSMDDIVIGAMGEPLEATTITPSQVADTQGSLIKLENVAVTLKIKNNSYGAEFFVENEQETEGVSLFYYPADRGNTVKLNVKYDYIIGFSSVYIRLNYTHIKEKEWEVWPRGRCDWKAVGETEKDYCEEEQNKEGNDAYCVKYAFFVNIALMLTLCMFL
eukprot:270796_1